VIASALRKQPALFLLLSFLLPLLESWSIVPLALAILFSLKEIRGRGLILLASSILGWNSQHSLKLAEENWALVEKSQGFMDVQVKWHRDVYTVEGNSPKGWASITPIQQNSLDERMTRDAQVTLVGHELLNSPSAKMAGNRWNGRMLVDGDGLSFFIKASFRELIPPSPLIHLRNAIVERLESHWELIKSEPALPLVRALITGDRYGLEAQQKLPFARLGLLALLAISGLHLGIIFLSARWLLKPYLGEPSNWVALMITMVYATLGGWSIALVRSFGMCFLAVIAKSTLRKYQGWNALFFMAWLELLLHPSHLYSPSFLLTYGGVIGILWSSFLIKKHLPPSPQGQSPKFLRRVLEAYLFSWGAMLFTWPITGVFFSSIPTLAWLWAPPFFLTFSLVMAWVFLCLVISLAMPLPTPMLGPLEAYLRLLHWFSESGAWVSFKDPGDIFWVIPYYLGLGIVLLEKKKEDDSAHQLER
jgi:ComEC/Rec2-related protein